jgi:Flp pilus assembly pilin Flp
MNDLILSTWTHGQVFLTRFARDEKGAALAEYAVIFIVVAIAGTVGLLAVGNNLNTAFNNIGTWIATNITNRFGAAAAG